MRLHADMIFFNRKSPVSPLIPLQTAAMAFASPQKLEFWYLFPFFSTFYTITQNLNNRQRH
jgi:hypothetical protein